MSHTQKISIVKFGTQCVLLCYMDPNEIIGIMHRRCLDVFERHGRRVYAKFGVFSPEVWSEKRMFSDGLQGISQGTVFIVNVQVELVNSGRSDVIGVTHLPTDLQKMYRKFWPYKKIRGVEVLTTLTIANFVGEKRVSVGKKHANRRWVDCTVNRRQVCQQDWYGRKIEKSAREAPLKRRFSSVRPWKIFFSFIISLVVHLIVIVIKVKIV